MIISCSWDDGTRSDKKLVRLLNELGIKSTFFLVGRHFNKDWKQLYEGHEVGNHTMNHVNLLKCNFKEIKKEILDCQKLLEDIFQRRIVGFCYLYGHRSNYIDDIVFEQNFLYTRTTRIIDEFNPKRIDSQSCFDNKNKFWQTYYNKNKYFVFHGHSQNIVSQPDLRENLKKMVKDKNIFVTHDKIIQLRNII
jgi:peptidoglycan/xylan/chitin deacetylase (PgdA/CDA1 family)